jgi:effector-binding domain-containing protein
MVDFENKEHFKPILNTVKELLKVQKNDEIVLMLDNAEIYVSNTDYNSWNGVDYFGYTLYINISVSEYVGLDIESVEKQIKNAFGTVTRNIDDSSFTRVIISPKSDTKIDWSKAGLSKQDLIEKINYLKNTMISVSTGGAKIQSVEEQYSQIYNEIKKVLKKLDIVNPNNYDSLWNWYGKWSNDFSTYQERRNYINGLYSSLFNILSDEDDTKIVTIKIDLTGWEKIDHSIIEINNREKQAKSEDQYQAVGMLCRELITHLTQKQSFEYISIALEIRS